MSKVLSLGPLLISIDGLQLTEVEEKRLSHPLVGGVILFSRNYVSKGTLIELVASIANLREPKLLIAVDHEGGRVQRFKHGFTELPAMRQCGLLYEIDENAALKTAYTTGYIAANELRACGIDINFAPVLDLDFGVSDIMGSRCFHSNPHVVTSLARAYIKGHRYGGMASIGKHFPGHGGVAGDTHISSPIDQRNYQELYHQDIHPFIELLANDLDAIMPSHVIYEAVDDRPACFSKVWLLDILRRQLSYKGLIISDDLSMAAASAFADAPTCVAAALSAGCSMVLVCNAPQRVDDIFRAYENKKFNDYSESLTSNFQALLQYQNVITPDADFPDSLPADYSIFDAKKQLLEGLSRLKN